MPSVVLYHSPYSPPSRSVLLLSRFLNLDVDVKILDLLKGEQLSPEFLRINPQHCVPTINDNGFHLWESRAILSYLMESRVPELSPSSPQAKAILNQRLYFELGDLASKYAAIYVSGNDNYTITNLSIKLFRIETFKRPLFAGETEMDREKIKELYVTLRIIDEFYFPNGSKWIAGENITVADFAYVATISGLIVSFIESQLNCWKAWAASINYITLTNIRKEGGEAQR